MIGQRAADTDQLGIVVSPHGFLGKDGYGREIHPPANLAVPGGFHHRQDPAQFRKPGGFHLVPGGNSLTGERAYERTSSVVL